MNVALPEAEKRLVLAAFDAVERDAGRFKLSDRAQMLLGRAKEVIAGQARVQRKIVVESCQLPILFPKRLKTIQRRGRKRYSIYPFEMVEDARRMRANSFGYREIAEALNREYGTNVSWVTIRDWTVQAYRVTG